MNRFMKKISALKPTKRKLIQLYTALLFNANLKGFVDGEIYQGSTKNLCIPGLNCYSCPGAVGACPLGSLQGAFSADKSTLYYVGGILLLYCFLFGRLICGWLCPFGLIQELLYKIKTPKLKKSPVTRVLSYLKYVVLVFFVFIIPIIYAMRDVPLPAFCKFICPAGTFEGGIGLLANEVNSSYFSMLGPLFTWKFALLISFAVGCVFIFRMFCRFICPLGALYGLFNRMSLFGIKVEKPKCTNCNMCTRHCKMDIKRPGDHECIGCGECIDVCPTQAIGWKSPLKKKKKAESLGDTVKGHEKARLITRTVSCILLIAFLIFAFVAYWNESNDAGGLNTATGDEADTSVPVGNQVGDRCYGAALPLINGEEILTDTVDPSKTGKITIINFWGTWCTPCVQELPDFQRIATEYADSVSVFAIHSNMSGEITTAPAFIAKYYPESSLIFAADLANQGYYTALGGRGTYPYTVILDENGIITDVYFKSLHYDELKGVIDRILND